MSLTAEAGTITALLGHNGAGKSTLLSIAATLLRPTSGKVLYGDTPAEAGGAPLRGRIGMLGHDLYLYPELTAAENLRSSPGSTGSTRSRGAWMLRSSARGLTERRDDLVAGFSRGMRQKLALERALHPRAAAAAARRAVHGLDDAPREALRERLRVGARRRRHHHR